MILDNNLILSDGQAVTATAASTNVIDTGPNSADWGKGQEMVVTAQVDTDFATCDSLKVTLQDSADNSSFATLLDGIVVAVASLVAGKKLLQVTIPPTHRRYLRLNYTIAGSNATAGKVNAHIGPATAIQTA